MNNEFIDGDFVDTEVVDAEVVEVVNSEVVEVVDGEVIDDLDYNYINLDFDLNEEPPTDADMAYGYTVNSSSIEEFDRNKYRSQNSSDSSASLNDSDYTSEDKSKFKTLIYLNRKISASLVKELKTLKKEIVDAYRLALKSSVIEYVDIQNSLIGSNAGENSEFSVVVGNTIYQYKIHNLSIPNIVDNLSLRLTFRRINDSSRTGSLSSRELKTNLEGYKHHMAMLVPIVISKFSGSWYERLLNQYNITLGLLTPTLFKNYELNDIAQMLSDEAQSGFNYTNKRERVDKLILNILGEGFELFEEKIYDDDLRAIISNTTKDQLAMELLESLVREVDDGGHKRMEYPSLSEIFSYVTSDVTKFDSFMDDYGMGKEDVGRFPKCIAIKIAENVQEDKNVAGYCYHDSKVTQYAGKGTAYSDLSIPTLYRNWLTTYHKPFSDREVVDIFLKSYVQFCSNSEIECPLSSSEPLKDLIEGNIPSNEFNKIIKFVNQAIYSRQYPIASLVEYSQYIRSLHEKLGIPEPLCNTHNNDIFFGISYLSQRVEHIKTLDTNPENERFTITCNCSSGIIDTSTNDMDGIFEVPDYLTVIRIDPSNDKTIVNFDLAESISLNVANIQIDSNSFEDIGLVPDRTADLITQELVVCKNCGKVHMFPEKIYRALDICAQKFLSERINTSKLKFVERCTLSRECVAEFEEVFYSYMESIPNISLENLPLDLPVISEKDLVETEVEETDFSEFNRLATEFIENLSKNKEQYKYEASISELKLIREEVQNNAIMPNISDIMSSFEDIARAIDNDEDNTASLDINKMKLDKKYYNNFIWYFLSNNLIQNMDSEKLIKLRISELFGKSNIDFILNTHKEIKKVLKEIGKYQFNLICDLNNSGSFPSVDLAGNVLADDADIEVGEDDSQYKVSCKCINMGKRALLNSDSREEFVSNIDLCSIGGKALSEQVKSALIAEYDGNKKFEYDNKELLSALSESSSTTTCNRRQLEDTLKSLREEIEDLVLSVDFSKTDGCYRDNYVDFDLHSFCIIIGSIFMKKNLKDFDYSKELAKIDTMSAKFIACIDSSFCEFDEGASHYLNYLLSTMDYRLDYEEVKETCVLSNFLDNFCLMCRKYIEPSEKAIEDNVPLSVQFRDNCITEIDNAVSSMFYHNILSDVYEYGVSKLVDSIEANFRSFAFRLLESFAVDLYNPSLVNSAVGKGLSKVEKKLINPSFLSKDDIDDVLKSFPSMGQIFPRISATSVISSIKNMYGSKPNSFKFKVLNMNGSVISQSELLDKVRVDILCMFMLMDISFCYEKDKSYEMDIFKVFNMVFSLPSTFLNKGIRDNLPKFNCNKYARDYDLGGELVDSICDSQAIIDCAISGTELNFTLEKSQLDELIILQKLCLDTSIVPYRASQGLIQSELVGSV